MPFNCGAIDGPHAFLQVEASVCGVDALAAAVVFIGFAADVAGFLKSVEQARDIVLGEQEAVFELHWAEAVGAVPAGTTSVMRPSSTTTSACRAGPPEPSTSLPLRTTRSAIGGQSSRSTGIAPVPHGRLTA